MKHDNNWDNSITPEVLPKLEYSHISHTAVKDSKFQLQCFVLGEY
jgi:hypothetical protein